jgi:hypothetical protein
MKNKGSVLEVIGVCLLVMVIMGFFGVVGIALGIISLPVKTVTKQIDSAGKIIDKTYDADNAIYNYEWFKSQYQRIVAVRQQINQTVKSIDEYKQTYGNNTKTWDYSVKQGYNTLSQTKTGLMYQEDNLVADYNAKSEMVNRAIFKDKLPFYVDKILW